jgi:hypothetical protein
MNDLAAARYRSLGKEIYCMRDSYPCSSKRSTQLRGMSPSSESLLLNGYFPAERRFLSVLGISLAPSHILPGLGDSPHSL